MQKRLDRYVGRIVRLNQRVFDRISRTARFQGLVPENRFLVAEASRQMRRLVCYGANLRVIVGPSEVILI